MHYDANGAHRKFWPTAGLTSGLRWQPNTCESEITTFVSEILYFRLKLLHPHFSLLLILFTVPSILYGAETKRSGRVDSMIVWSVMEGRKCLVNREAGHPTST